MLPFVLPLQFNKSGIKKTKKNKKSDCDAHSKAPAVLRETILADLGKSIQFKKVVFTVIPLVTLVGAWVGLAMAWNRLALPDVAVACVLPTYPLLVAQRLGLVILITVS